MISREEVDALEVVVAYLMGNEKISFDEWIAEGGNPNEHIYGKAVILNDYVNGLYSTGNIS
jgi:hypothetical protein